MVLLVFMIGITVSAPWIGNNILGFDPTDTNLRMRSKPPTWAERVVAGIPGIHGTCASR